MSTAIGIIGSGPVGAGVARRALSAGWNVVLGNSRGPASLAELIAQLGQGANAGSAREAADTGDVVVVATPLAAVSSLPADALAGKLVLDTTNYVPARDGDLTELDTDQLTSSQLVQQQLKSARVVKVFNNIAPHHLLALARPSGAQDRSALPIASDDLGATNQARGLIDALGFDTVDLGRLADSWRSEPNAPLYALPYAGTAPQGLALPELLEWFQASPGAPVPAAHVEELAAAAVRGPAGVRF